MNFHLRLRDALTLSSVIDIHTLHVMYVYVYESIVYFSFKVDFM